MTANDDKNQKTANDDTEPNLRVLTLPSNCWKKATPEKPLEDVAPRDRLGQLFRSYRNKAGRNLRETAQALEPYIESTVMLGEIERGRRPATADQIQAFCDYIGVGTDAFYDAARDYHRSVWEPRSHPLRVGEQVAKVSSTEPVYDQQELVSALRGAVNSMDIASELLARVARVLRHDEKWNRDGEMAASVAMMLEAGSNYSRRLLQTPLEPLQASPPDWTDEGEARESDES